MSWIQVRAEFKALPPDLSPWIELYREHGIENTLEDGVGLSGCLADVAGAQAQVERLSAGLKELGADEVITSELAESNWEEVWRSFFKPTRIGRRFVVRPTWEPFEAEPADVVIDLDPGLAFGTGDHPTTRMCLELLEGCELAGARVADLGCGSGILAIACAKLGAKVLACDLDPIAVEVARQNTERNDVAIGFLVGDGLSEGAGSLDHAPQDEVDLEELPPIAAGSRPSARAVERGFDLIVSNIISHTLIRLCPQVAGALATRGEWIVSGIIQSNWAEVCRAAGESRFQLVEERHEGGWVAAKFRLPGSR